MCVNRQYNMIIYVSILTKVYLKLYTVRCRKGERKKERESLIKPLFWLQMKPYLTGTIYRTTCKRVLSLRANFKSCQ